MALKIETLYTIKYITVYNSEIRDKVGSI